MATGSLILFILGVCMAVFRYMLSSRVRRLPNVFVAGLNGGERSLQQAREHFTANCAQMMLEGYEKVVLWTNFHVIRFELLLMAELDQWWLLLRPFSVWRAADDSHAMYRGIEECAG